MNSRLSAAKRRSLIGQRHWGRVLWLPGLKRRRGLRNRRVDLTGELMSGRKLVIYPRCLGLDQVLEMFELKKRNSLTLRCRQDEEEFRRVAVRRKVKGATLQTGEALWFKCPTACTTVTLACSNRVILHYA